MPQEWCYHGSHTSTMDAWIKNGQVEATTEDWEMFEGVVTPLPI